MAVVLIFGCTPSKKTMEQMNHHEPAMGIVYPKTKKVDTITDYFGTKVADPYRWLEDDNSAATKSWVEAQNKLTFGYLNAIPYKAEIKARLKTLWNYEKVSAPFREGSHYYYYKNDGLQNQSILYQASGLKQEGKVFVDPNKLSSDGTTSLSSVEFSKDGKLMAYLISEAGSDWRIGKVRHVDSGKDLEDNLRWIKFSGTSWAGHGFYYSRYPASSDGQVLSGKNEYHSLYYHKIGDDQSRDQLVFRDDEHPLRNVYASTSDDERFLVVSVVESTSGNAFKIKDLSKANSPMIDVVTSFEKNFTFIDSEGDMLYFITDDGAPKSKLIGIDIKKTERSQWVTVIPEGEDKLESVSLLDGKFFVNYLHNVASEIKAFDINGRLLGSVKLPGLGNASGVSGRKEDNFGFYSFTSFNYPNSVFKLNTKTFESDLYNKPTLDFEPDDFVVEQQWYKSKDGTSVPMFITYKKGMKRDGQSPAMLYGYGGFDVSETPNFSPSIITFLEKGGIFALANIRGGGEFGEAWHKAGTKERKQNVFDDFIAGAEFLIDQSYTSKSRLAIRGGSNGGLLVGACMTQRPDLFAVAFPAVGVLDMLRYHEFTIGWAWASDYGKSSDPEAFKYLYKYSPLHNVKAVRYPSTMITTADHDDRVVPAHSFKFAATLQEKHTGTNPVLIRIETSAGHGAGVPTDKRIEEAADMWSFLFHETGTWK